MYGTNNGMVEIPRDNYDNPLGNVDFQNINP